MLSLGGYVGFRLYLLFDMRANAFTVILMNMIV